MSDSLWIIGIVIVASCAPLLMLRDIWLFIKLSKEGIQTIGTVLFYDSDMDGTVLKYEYEDRNGKQKVFKQAYFNSNKEIAIGDKINILYLPNHKNFAHFGDANECRKMAIKLSRKLFFIMLFMLVFNLIFCWFMV